VRRREERTDKVKDTSPRSTQLTHHPLRLDVNNADDEVVANGSEETVVALKEDRADGRFDGEGTGEAHGLEVEELERPRKRESGREEGEKNGKGRRT
jgi:hypothetical protein